MIELTARRMNPFCINYILDYYKSDIKNYFPEFHMDMTSIDTAYIVCADAILAGILLGRRVNGDTFLSL
ncbi:MAG: hypothetical protein Q4E89_12870 [Eubacteriales bacterium]|nr:hypothetical protein [Eubacteriales bacterium]